MLTEGVPAAPCNPNTGIVSVYALNPWWCYTGMQDAVDLLHPLLTDTVDYVKQGALIATALVLMQQPESKVPCLRMLYCMLANSFGSAQWNANCIRPLHPSIKQHILQLQACTLLQLHC